MRYCYVLRSSEIDIVRVYTGRNESEIEGIKFAKRQGADEATINRLNDEITVIEPSGNATPMRVWVERHELK